MSQDLFKKISATIRKERLYADIDLMREDIMSRQGHVTPGSGEFVTVTEYPDPIVTYCSQY